MAFRRLGAPLSREKNRAYYQLAPAISACVGRPGSEPRSCVETECARKFFRAAEDDRRPCTRSKLQREEGGVGEDAGTTRGTIEVHHVFSGVPYFGRSRHVLLNPKKPI